MGMFSKDIDTLDQLFLHTLQDIYYTEQKLVKALPQMIEKAATQDLRQAFEDHLEETRGHVQRLEDVFEMYGEQPKSVRCPAIDGIVEEANEVSAEVEDKKVLDAALAAAAQAVEHYEISRYGSLVAWAEALGRDDCANILQETLEEEKAADKKLTELAEAGLNREAV